MPIYEYQSLTPEKACPECRDGFEVYQRIDEKPLSTCRQCRNRVRKIISWCHSAVLEESAEHHNTLNKIKAYEKSGMWSHAAELADKHAEKIKDNTLKTRALENYKKAGYTIDSLTKREKSNNK